MSFEVNWTALRIKNIQVVSEHEGNTFPGCIVPEKPAAEKSGFEVILVKNLSLPIMLPPLSGAALGINKPQQLVVGIGEPFLALIGKTVDLVKDIFGKRVGYLIGRAGNPVQNMFAAGIFQLAISRQKVIESGTRDDYPDAGKDLGHFPQVFDYSTPALLQTNLRVFRPCGMSA